MQTRAPLNIWQLVPLLQSPPSLQERVQRPPAPKSRQTSEMQSLSALQGSPSCAGGVSHSPVCGLQTWPPPQKPGVHASQSPVVTLHVGVGAPQSALLTH